MTAHATLFATQALGGLALPNRLAVAPMTRVSATVDGLPTECMRDYYRRFADGGFGLVISEGLYTDVAYSQGYAFQPGMATSVQCDAWEPIVATVKEGGARFVAQLMHAGALSQANVHRSATKGPSAVQPKGKQMTFYRGVGDYPMPEPMTVLDIADAVVGFASAARRAADAGFDGVEIHAANGYLIDQFLSEGTNHRTDAYGGDLVARMRLLREVVAAVRTAVGPAFPVGVRISQGKVNDFTYKWRDEEEAIALFKGLATLALDYVHVTEFEAWQPAFAQGPSLAALARQYSGLAVLANGGLHAPGRAVAMLDGEQAHAVSLGRGALTHADWPRRVRDGIALATFDPGILAPIADLAHAEQHR